MFWSLDVAKLVCNPSIWVAEAGGSQIQGQPGLCRELEVQPGLYENVIQKRDSNNQGGRAQGRERNDKIRTAGLSFDV